MHCLRGWRVRLNALQLDRLWTKARGIVFIDSTYCILCNPYPSKTLHELNATFCCAV